MEYRALGRTGITVSQLTLGAMMFGAIGNHDREECVRIVHRALDAGITSINTADGYSAGQSEEIRLSRHECGSSGCSFVG